MRFSRALVLFGLFALAVACWAGPWTDLNSKLQQTPDADVVKTAEATQGLNDAQFKALFPSDDATAAAKRDAVKKIRGYANLRSAYENSSKQPDSASIQQIKESGLYRKAATPDTSENWLARAIDRIRVPQLTLPKTPARMPASMGSLGFLSTLMWILLGGAVVVLLVFAIRAIAKRSGVRRQASAILEDEEPERPLDEWLKMADELEREGKFRDAVRCLYVACLLRFDEANVARFDRTHTNWEHFRRVMASPAAPQAFDFRTPTRDFDRIWYGHGFTDASDVLRFRTTYTSLTAILKSPKAGAAA